MWHLALCQSLTLSSFFWKWSQPRAAYPPLPNPVPNISVWQPCCELNQTAVCIIPTTFPSALRTQANKCRPNHNKQINQQSSVKIQFVYPWPLHSNNIWLCWHKCYCFFLFCFLGGDICRPKSRQELNAMVCYSLTCSLVCLQEFIYCFQQSL